MYRLTRSHQKSKVSSHWKWMRNPDINSFCASHFSSFFLSRKSVSVCFFCSDLLLFFSALCPPSLLVPISGSQFYSVSHRTYSPFDSCLWWLSCAPSILLFFLPFLNFLPMFLFVLFVFLFLLFSIAGKIVLLGLTIPSSYMYSQTLEPFSSSNCLLFSDKATRLGENGALGTDVTRRENVNVFREFSCLSILFLPRWSRNPSSVPSIPLHPSILHYRSLLTYLLTFFLSFFCPILLPPLSDVVQFDRLDDRYDCVFENRRLRALISSFLFSVWTQIKFRNEWFCINYLLGHRARPRRGHFGWLESALDAGADGRKLHYFYCWSG